MPVQQITPVTCPNCNAQFTAPTENVINGEDLAKKNAFLQGQLNTIHCPQCGFVGVPELPVFYYDLEKELALVFVPGGLNVMGPEQDKIIGELTNKVVNSLPTEQRKFFLFNPKNFLTLESLVMAVFEADGITKEMLQAQESRVKLLEELFTATDEATLKEKVKAHDAELDRDFFELLTATIQTAQFSGDQARAQTFVTLRSLISRWSTNGKEIVAEIDKELGIVVMKSQEELLERLQNAKDNNEFEALVVSGHVFLDYGFFQQLTAKIDQAAKSGDTKTSQSLSALRTKILDTQAKSEERNKVALEKAANLLKELFQSNQPDKLLDQKLDQIDDAFFFILQANIEEARRQGHDEPAQAMEMIANIAVSKLQEKFGKNEEASQADESPKIHVAGR